MTYTLEPSWQSALQEELQKPYISELASFVQKERMLGKKIYPPEELVFNALTQTPFTQVRVVILGQDPYHGPGQAHGLSFSVPDGQRLPPSLQNIFKELHADLQVPAPPHGCLLKWAKQGVLLLNVTLTVAENEPLSHHNKGWERFTDAVIQKLALRKEPVIFLLWGKNAQDACSRVPELLQNTQHTILCAAHPSPFSAYRGFFGCAHFSKVNALLQSRGEPPIDWRI